MKGDQWSKTIEEINQKIKKGEAVIFYGRRNHRRG